MRVAVEVRDDISSPEVLEAMLAMVDQGPEPGSLRPQDVLHRGDGEIPAPMVASTLKSAGYTVVYDKRTGEPSLCNNNMLPAQLRKKDEEGNRVFTWVKPEKEPARGTTRCVLHADRREPWMDEAGLPTCSKANLTSEYQARMHAQHRHKSEWAAIELRRKEEIEKEDRAARQALLMVVQGKASQDQAPASKKGA